MDGKKIVETLIAFIPFDRSPELSFGTRIRRAVKTIKALANSKEPEAHERYLFTIKKLLPIHKKPH